MTVEQSLFPNIVDKVQEYPTMNLPKIDFQDMANFQYAHEGNNIFNFLIAPAQILLCNLMWQHYNEYHSDVIFALQKLQIPCDLERLDFSQIPHFDEHLGINKLTFLKHLLHQEVKEHNE